MKALASFAKGMTVKVLRAVPGSHSGGYGIVVDPNWNAQVKIRMLGTSEEIRSCLPQDLEPISDDSSSKEEDDDLDMMEDFLDVEDEDLKKLDLLKQGLIHPEYGYKTTWDIVVCGFIIYSVISAIYYIGFSTGPIPGSGHFVLDVFIDICFGIDILLNFFTAYIDDSILITDRKQIAKKYCCSWFLLDFISTFPFQPVFELFTGEENDSMKFLRLGRALRLVRLVKIRYDRLLSIAHVCLIQPSHVHPPPLSVLFQPSAEDVDGV